MLEEKLKAFRRGRQRRRSAHRAAHAERAKSETLKAIAEEHFAMEGDRLRSIDVGKAVLERLVLPAECSVTRRAGEQVVSVPLEPERPAAGAPPLTASPATNLVRARSVAAAAVLRQGTFGVVPATLSFGTVR